MMETTELLAEILHELRELRELLASLRDNTTYQ